MKYLKAIGSTIIIVLFINIFFSTLSYFNIIHNGNLIFIEVILVLITIFVTSFRLVKEKKKKTYDGTIYGSIIAFIFILVRLIVNKLYIIKFIYYLLIILVAFTGNLFALRKKK